MNPFCAIMEKLCKPATPGTAGRKDRMNTIFENKEEFIRDYEASVMSTLGQAL